MAGRRVRAIVGLAAILSAAAFSTGAGTADSEDPISRNAVSRHSFDIPTASGKVRDLWRSRPTWAGAYTKDITFMHPGQGTLVVLVSDHVQEVYDRVPAGLKPFVTVARGGVAEAACGPFSDCGGWTGGNRISSASRTCTEGFTWKTWATGAALGSTAKHCATTDGAFTHTRWYHEGRHLGDLVAAPPGTVDFMLLSPAPATSFNASIWVRLGGGAVEERIVTTATTNVEGDTIAFYGVTSGGGSGKILLRGGPLFESWIWTDAAAVRPGDSGGPVYRTTSSGTVDARGTVARYTYRDNNGNDVYDAGDTIDGMIFVDAVMTSYAVSASIYTP